MNTTLHILFNFSQNMSFHGVAYGNKQETGQVGAPLNVRKEYFQYAIGHNCEIYCAKKYLEGYP